MSASFAGGVFAIFPGGLLQRQHADGCSIRPVVIDERRPMEFKCLVPRLCDPRSPAAGPVVGDPDARRMPDDAARIDGEELGWNASDEVPDAAAASEKIGHRQQGMLDEMLDSFAPTHRAKHPECLLDYCNL
jgi:hypothetical protein